LFTNYLEEPDKNYIYKEVLYEVKLKSKYIKETRWGLKLVKKQNGHANKKSGYTKIFSIIKIVLI